MRIAHRLILCGVALVAAAAPVLADDEPKIDARFLGYPQGVQAPEPASAGLVWLLLVLLGLLCVGPLFMNAKRTHLD